MATGGINKGRKMALFEMEIEVVCGECGDALTTTESQDSFSINSISVEPCETCLGKEYDRGVEDAEE